MEETADKRKGSPNRKTAAMDMNEKQVMRSWASDCGPERDGLRDGMERTAG